jgi:DNA-directed RNA polymerase subunit M/transcription elongation factor TFIIS
MIGRRFAPHCPLCEDGHGVWRLLTITGRTRTAMYACGICTHQWTIVQSPELPGHDPARWVGECPSCEDGRGVIRGVKIDRENRTRTYRCEACSHQWAVTDAPAINRRGVL